MLKRKNRNVVYSGRVGVKMRPRARKPSRRVLMVKHRCIGGPLDGATITLALNCDGQTLPLVLRGCAGRYVAGRWEGAA